MARRLEQTSVRLLCPVYVQLLSGPSAATHGFLWYCSVCSRCRDVNLSASVRQISAASACGVQTGGQKGRRGRRRLTQLPTTTSGRLKYDTKLREQQGEIKRPRCAKNRWFSEHQWLNPPRLWALLVSRWRKRGNSGSPATRSRHIDPHPNTPWDKN